ncbi:MAG: M6 family metalloprotease domain-containing protein [Nitrospirae bacterium]|nr:M6 family metalloprotease domain-containing protein [Nitrospirota bacterium]
MNIQETRIRKWSLVVICCLLGLIMGTGSGFGLEPPTPQELEQYKNDGTLQQRIEQAKNIGNHLTDPQLVVRQQYKLQKIQLKQSGMTEAEISQLMAPPPAWAGGLPATGTVKVLAVLINFSDYTPFNTQTTINGKLFGSGSPADYPYESLKNYYSRASYNQLTIQGNTLGWYTTAYPRSSVAQTDAGRETLLKEVLNYYNAQGHDFSQYDNDGDGYIDYMIVVWTGADNGWANFWWGYQTSFGDSSYTLDGKKLFKYSWQWEANPWSAPGTYDQVVVMHETGHALGLPDYYDYDNTQGPDGGVGGLDMMDGNVGDHGCFSKWLLDWLSPAEVVTVGTNTYTMRATGAFPDCVMVMPGAQANNTFQEYFLVQNRFRTQNDATLFTAKDGLLIWHVDARLDGSGWNYLYDNSYTSHKLLRLMEADGLEQIEAGSYANAGDYYVTGKTFGPGTTPNSNMYSGTSSQITVSSISAAAETMTAQIAIAGMPPPPPTLGAAVDNTALTWTTGGNANWAGQTTTTHDGVDAAQSGSISHNQSTWMETTITGPGTLTYWWKVSSEATYDFLRFYLDGAEQTGSISGNVDWAQRSHGIPSGSHTIRWTYTKDYSVSSGLDAGWVDQVVWTPSACSYSINPTSAAGLAAGGAGSVSVTTGAGCSWTAVSNAGWITITSGSSGSGNGTVNYSYTANGTGSPRTGTMTIAGQTFTLNQAASAATLTVLTPNGGEVLAAGSTYQITWNAPAEATKFTLQYSLNAGTAWKTIATNVAGAFYNWTVPALAVNKPNCLVKVIGYNAGGTQLALDQSNAVFRIEVIKVISPNGAEVWRSGEMHPITWTTNVTTKPIAKVNLYYKIDSTGYKLITSFTGTNPGTYNWTIPVVATNRPASRVKVELIYTGIATKGNDISDANFTISP